MKFKKEFLISGVSILGLIFFFLFNNKINHLNEVSIVGFLLVLFIFYFSDKLFNFNFETIHYLLIIYVATSGFLLSCFMFIFKYMDKVLHFTGGVILALIIFHISKKLKIQKKAFFTFIVCLMIILIYEIIEYLMGYFSITQMQGVFVYLNGEYKMILSPLRDTLADIFLGIFGGLIYLFGKFKSTVL